MPSNSVSDCIDEYVPHFFKFSWSVCCAVHCDGLWLAGHDDAWSWSDCDQTQHQFLTATQHFIASTREQYQPRPLPVTVSSPQWSSVFSLHSSSFTNHGWGAWRALFAYSLSCWECTDSRSNKQVCHAGGLHHSRCVYRIMALPSLLWRLPFADGVSELKLSFVLNSECGGLAWAND